MSTLERRLTNPFRAQFASRKRVCGAPVEASRCGSRVPRARAVAGAVMASGEKKSVLIVNTNGGGHANIGFWLAKTLAAAGHDVTMNVVGAEDDKKMAKTPFTLFDEIRSMGVKTVWANPDEVSTKHAGAKFDVVVDNNGKDMDTVGPVADFAVAAGASQFLFVSSAGIYKPTPCPPHVEGDAVKETSGHALVEAHLKTLPLKMSSFRPQYLTGYGSNKDCEEWFFDRVVRGRPILVPGSGDQLSSVTHAEDLATMIAAAVGNDAAAGEIFNCVTTKAVTLNGMAELCAKAAGVEPNVINYDPASVPDIEVKKAFPFRPIHFYSSSAKAQAVLGWSPKHPDLSAELKERLAYYKSIGRDKKEMSFEIDDKILAAIGK